MSLSLRSPIIQLGVRAATPLAAVLGVYLLFAGHNNPGGGFAAGLVFGAIVTLRVMAGLQPPEYAFGLTASGMLIVAVVSILPLLWGDPLLDQKIVETNVALLGKIKTGSALPFDIGVTLIVVGLVVALLDGLSPTTSNAVAEEAS